MFYNKVGSKWRDFIQMKSASWMDFKTLTSYGLGKFSFPLRGRQCGKAVWEGWSGAALLFSLTAFLSPSGLLQSLNKLNYFEFF